MQHKGEQREVIMNESIVADVFGKKTSLRNIEQLRNQACSQGISKSVSQSVSLKFCSIRIYTYLILPMWCKVNIKLASTME